MPIYSYRCQDPECAAEFEEIKSFEDLKKEKIIECPECGEEARRIPSLIARMTGNWSLWANLN